ncbi:uncharacterized protein LOC115384901 [Salarias fasciatus]|uniref:uncharacterized protein LOC115384901 n=1 Tax=Salarias fasciatus TaxID=181472 RepID=UPI001176B392|nr:uncharacterized protein LOC115384901 [Salarias fasciatus]
MEMFLVLMMLLPVLAVMAPPLHRGHVVEDLAGPQDNLWWRAARAVARGLHNSSCIVCAFMPHATPANTLLIPHPVSLSDSLYTFIRYRKNQTLLTLRYPNATVPPLTPFREPMHFSNITNFTCAHTGTIYELRGLRSPFGPPPLCVRQPARTRSHLGDTVGCALTLNVSCSVDHQPCPNATSPHASTWWSGSPLWSVIYLNYSVFTNMYSLFLQWDAKTVLKGDIVSFPSRAGYGCPTDMVWVCGHRSYIYLPRDWSGTCYLAHLIPAVTVHSSAADIPGVRRLRKRAVAVPEDKRRIGWGQAFWGGFFPWHGTVRNQHEINSLAWELENLTGLVTDGFDLLTDEQKAERVMGLQNRVALDLLLAEKGGVCALIGDHCCTWVPDVSDNMTNIHAQLSSLLAELHAQEKEQNVNQGKQ